MKVPSFRLDGKIALITGSGRGIGLGMAHALAANGCAVAIQDIDVDVAGQAAEDIRRDWGARAIALGGDVTDLTLPERLVKQTVDQLGGIHILINNAAIQQHEHWLEMSLQSMERQVRADLMAPVVLCQQVVPIFKRQRWGRIINMGSIQGKGGNPTMLAYAMSKAALANMTIGLARDLVKDGITVNLIAPGYFDTYRNREQFPDEQAKKERAKWVPMEIIGDPEDCSGAALLLCSDAGYYITGQILYVDGGLSAR
jgi:NAD(P)-dependent dehydrogenase (short-subunit alcohol dehydrogenase family)